MYFHGVKSTAHPLIIGALGHSTDCIVKQSYIFGFMQACCVLLEEELHLQTIKHTYIRKFNVCPSWVLLLLLSGSVCADCGWINVSFKNFQKSWQQHTAPKPYSTRTFRNWLFFFHIIIFHIYMDYFIAFLKYFTDVRVKNALFSIFDPFWPSPTGKKGATDQMLP